jgi:acylphosphatase
MPVCKRVHYWGRVQGVGFRVTTQHVAGQFEVTGYVRNLPDGDVEAVVAGDADEVTRFIEALNQRMAAYIRGHRIDDEPMQDFQGFEIRN